VCLTVLVERTVEESMVSGSRRRPDDPGDTDPPRLTSDPVCTGGPQGWDPHVFRTWTEPPDGYKPIGPGRTGYRVPRTVRGSAGPTEPPWPASPGAPCALPPQSRVLL